MPLSEEELRLLEQMERALVAEDPKFVSALRGTARRRDARRRALVAGAAFVVGIVVMMTGAVLPNTLVGIIGFVVMLASAVVALSAWRSQGGAPSAEDAPAPRGFDASSGLSVIEGGKKSRRRSARSGPSRQSMMQRLEERWRRRRDNGGAGGV